MKATEITTPSYKVNFRVLHHPTGYVGIVSDSERDDLGYLVRQAHRLDVRSSREDAVTLALAAARALAARLQSVRVPVRIYGEGSYHRL